MKKLLLLCCVFIGLTTASFAQMAAGSKPEEKAMELQKKLKLTDPQCKKVAASHL
jgi:protein CpxP